MSGACQTFPDFRFVLGEMGGAWIPFVLGRIDHIYHERKLGEKFDPPMEMLPSEYWTRQGATTFQEEPMVGQTAHLIGVDNLMWGSDYPHPDGVWPDSRTVVQDTLGEPGAVRLPQDHLRQCGDALPHGRITPIDSRHGGPAGALW